MMPSTFTTFDMIITSPHTTLLSYLWGLLPTLMFTHMYWITPSTKYIMMSTTIKITSSLTKSTNSMFVKSASSIMNPTLYSIIILNLWGAAPFTITLTSHLMTTLSMGAPTWLTLIIMNLSKSSKSMHAHFLPTNTPHPIASFLLLVETLSSYIRPLTLSFRLSANISAGHVILGMMASTATFAFLTSLSLTPLMTSSGYTSFELAICLVQAFVFTLLASMYTNDHLSPTH